MVNEDYETSSIAGVGAIFTDCGEVRERVQNGGRI